MTITVLKMDVTYNPMAILDLEKKNKPKKEKREKLTDD
jgi:hypothetical protein